MLKASDGKEAAPPPIPAPMRSDSHDPHATTVSAYYCNMQKPRSWKKPSYIPSSLAANCPIGPASSRLTIPRLFGHVCNAKTRFGSALPIHGIGTFMTAMNFSEAIFPTKLLLGKSTLHFCSRQSLLLQHPHGHQDTKSNPPRPTNMSDPCSSRQGFTDPLFSATGTSIA